MPAFFIYFQSFLNLYVSVYIVDQPNIFCLYNYLIKIGTINNFLRLN